MKFENFRLLEIKPAPNPAYFSGLEGEFEGTVVGKVRPWDDSCKEYVLYEDGDLILAEAR